MASLSVRSPTRAFGYGSGHLLVMRSSSHTGTPRARRVARTAVPPRLPARHLNPIDARATHCGYVGRTRPGLLRLRAPVLPAGSPVIAGSSPTTPNSILPFVTLSDGPGRG